MRWGCGGRWVPVSDLVRVLACRCLPLSLPGTLLCAWPVHKSRRLPLIAFGGVSRKPVWGTRPSTRPSYGRRRNAIPQALPVLPLKKIPDDLMHAKDVARNTQIRSTPGVPGLQADTRNLHLLLSVTRFFSQPSPLPFLNAPDTLLARPGAPLPLCSYPQVHLAAGLSPGELSPSSYTSFS